MLRQAFQGLISGSLSFVLNGLVLKCFETSSVDFLRVFPGCGEPSTGPWSLGV